MWRMVEPTTRAATILGVVGNLALTVFKFAAGLLSGSMAVLADSFHSLSDLLASSIVYIGMKHATRPPDERHPFGHGDVEALTGLFVAIILALVAYELGRGSILTILHGSATRIGPAAIYASAISVVAKEAMARYTFSAARKSMSMALEASAWDHRSDALSSVAVLAGVSLAMGGIWVADPIIAFGMACAIGFIGFRIARKNVENLIGTVPRPETVTKIERIVRGVPEVIDVHKIRLHYFGPYAEVDMHVVMDPKMTIEESHATTDTIIEIVRSTLPDIAFVNIHVEPR